MRLLSQLHRPEFVRTWEWLHTCGSNSTAQIVGIIEVVAGRTSTASRQSLAVRKILPEEPARLLIILS
jgi:hypothetical protein